MRRLENVIDRCFANQAEKSKIDYLNGSSEVLSGLTKATAILCPEEQRLWVYS